jgi:hypothetical protein
MRPLLWAQSRSSKTLSYPTRHKILTQWGESITTVALELINEEVHFVHRSVGATNVVAGRGGLVIDWKEATLIQLLSADAG